MEIMSYPWVCERCGSRYPQKSNGKCGQCDGILRYHEREDDNSSSLILDDDESTSEPSEMAAVSTKEEVHKWIKRIDDSADSPALEESITDLPDESLPDLSADGSLETASPHQAVLRNDRYLKGEKKYFKEEKFDEKVERKLPKIFGAVKNKTDRDRHTLRFSVDIVNLGNLLNRNWGLVKTTSINNFLKFEGIAADNKTPLLSFPYADATNQVPLVNSFTNNTNLVNFTNGTNATGSRWQMQFGIRYLFN